MPLLLYWLFRAHLQALHRALMGEPSGPRCIYPLPHSYKIIELNRRNLGGNLVLQLTQENGAGAHTVPGRFSQHQTPGL